MIQLSKTQLEQKYKSTTVKKLAEELKISPPTLIKLIKDSGIELKRSNVSNKVKITD
jgi:Mn-dependent DtxR family transcriptional regulator